MIVFIVGRENRVTEREMGVKMCGGTGSSSGNRAPSNEQKRSSRAFEGGASERFNAI